MRIAGLHIVLAALFYSCSGDTGNSIQIKSESGHEAQKSYPSRSPTLLKNEPRTIHVFVALCDNKYQGIVPVPKFIGNGQDPDNNLYWGCSYGIRTYFRKKTSDWTLLETRKNVSSTILERILFKHKTENIYLLADAWDGQFIRQTTIDYIDATSGKNELLYVHKGDSLHFGGSSDLTAYIGHDGLMDFELPLPAYSNDSSSRKSMILACYSKNYFSPYLKRTGAEPLLWTTGLMAPEAYTLHDAIAAWIAGKGQAEIQTAAAKAYSKYQKCSLKASKNLLVSGW